MTLSARKHLAQRIKLLRQSRGWSQEVLAELCGLNRSYIGAVERAEHNIGLDNIERIAQALELSITELINQSDISKIIHNQCTPHGTDPATKPVIILRQSLLDLIALTNQRNGELLITYLKRCGVIIRDS